MSDTGRPNILFIMTDQQRWDSLSCYGNRAIQTPHLDRLAREGARFDNCYAVNPICTPSRASLMTGVPVPFVNVWRLYDTLDPDYTLFPEHVKAQGYDTALIGKLHVSKHKDEVAARHPHDGFKTFEWCNEAVLMMDEPQQAYARWLENEAPDFYQELRCQGRLYGNVPREYHLTHWAAQRTIDFIEKDRGDEPFFCMMSVFDPHNPYDDYPPEYAERVDLSKLPPVTPLGTDQLPQALVREHQSSYMMMDAPEVGGPLGTDGPAPGTSVWGVEDFYSQEQIDKMRLGYYASLCLLDDEVGRIINVLEERGQLDDTLIVFTSDHGDMLGDHGQLAKGAYFYDPCVRVPLLMRQPGRISAGTCIESPVQLHDLTASFLDAAGLGAQQRRALCPESMSLYDVISGVNKRDFVTCCYRETGICKERKYFSPAIHATMIRDSRYKLNLYHSTPSLESVEECQLFDLDTDPLEQHDRSRDPALEPVERELHEKLRRWLERC